MSSAVAAVRLSGRMCRKESLSGIGEAVFGEKVGRNLLHPEAYLVFGFIARKISCHEGSGQTGQNTGNILHHIVMPLPENLRHLQAGDGGNREGPAKKAPCGWLGHTHRAEDETEERKLAISGLGAAKAAWPQGGPHRGRVFMIWTTLSIMSALRRSRPASGSNRIATLPSCGEGSRPWRAGSPGASLV